MGSETLSSGKHFAEFDFDSKILFNLWVRLWLPMGRSTDRVKLSRTLFTKALETQRTLTMDRVLY
ncbi:hypothetical protein [Leptospira noguchii]|uniref:Uncharacterized protein n=1 Tax=Leptospira noguchii TaxID=28182 RepID=A0AAE9GB06_9LEPT|nr:hypothetical protein [Leptospira noguchii]UOG53790.1 hypothetical protein MAL09_06660 [Leptospira noguchii]UOG55595.1 hypothetical protein MAL03_11855 [Leptospira noguchii]